MTLCATSIYEYLPQLVEKLLMMNFNDIYTISFTVKITVTFNLYNLLPYFLQYSFGNHSCYF